VFIRKRQQTRRTVGQLDRGLFEGAISKFAHFSHLVLHVYDALISDD
jgi:hypothetical protein